MLRRDLGRSVAVLFTVVLAVSYADIFTIRTNDSAFWGGTNTWDPTCCPGVGDTAIINKIGRYTILLNGTTTSIKNATIGNDIDSAPVLGILEGQIFIPEFLNLRRAASLAMSGYLIQNTSVSGSLELHGNISIPTGATALIVASNATFESYLDLQDRSTLVLYGPGTFKRRESDLVYAGTRKIAMDWSSTLQVPNVFLSYNASLEIGGQSVLETRNITAFAASIRLVQGSTLIANESLNIEEGSSIDAENGGIKAQNVSVSGLHSALDLRSSIVEMNNTYVTNFAAVSFNNCFAELSPFVVVNSTVVATNRAILTLKSLQKSSFFALENSTTIGELLLLVGPQSVFQITRNSSFYITDVGLFESELSVANSVLDLNGTLAAFSRTYIVVYQSVMNMKGGLRLQDTSFGMRDSQFIAAAGSDLLIECVENSEPPLIDGKLARVCEMSIITSTFVVEGQVVVFGRYAKLEVYESQGLIRSSNSSDGFKIGDGANFVALSSQVTMQGNALVFDGAAVLCANSTLNIGSYLALVNGSKIIANNNSVITMSRSLVMNTLAGAVVSNGSRFIIAGLIYATRYSLLIAEYGGKFEITRRAGVILELGSQMLLRSGGGLVGAGSINGTLINDGGIVSSLESGRTNITVVEYNSTSNSNSTLATALIDQSAGLPGNVTSSTFVSSQIAIIGGTIVVNVSSTLNQLLLTNGTSLGPGGIVLISASQNMTGTLPRLVVQLNDGSTSNVLISSGGASGCGYRLEQTSVTLAVVFDQSGCARSSSPLDTSAISSGLPIWVIPVAVVAGAIVVAAVGFGALVWFVPSLRSKLIPGAATRFHAKKLKKKLTAS